MADPSGNALTRVQTQLWCQREHVSMRARGKPAERKRKRERASDSETDLYF